MVRKKLRALKDRIGSDNLGPDRGTMDQLEARKERARIEAKREAQREKRQEKLEKARTRGRRQGKGLVKTVADGIERATEQFEELGGDLNSVDLDDDGTGLDNELQDPPAGLVRQVDENTEDISELERQFDGQVFDEGGGQQAGADGLASDPLGEASTPFERDDDDGGLF